MTKLPSISARNPASQLAAAFNRPLRAGGFALAAASVAVLAGCANYQSVKPGMSVAEAVQKLGKPTTTCTRDDGTQRLIWTMQP